MKIARVAGMLIGGAIVAASCGGTPTVAADGGDGCVCKAPVVSTVPCISPQPGTSTIAWATLEVPGAAVSDLLDVTAIGVLVPEAPVDRPDQTFGRMSAPVLLGDGFAAVACDRKAPTFAHVFSEVTFTRR